MPYISNTDADRKEMLAKIGVHEIQDLFRPVPENLRLKKPLNLPPALSELELLREIDRISECNKSNLAIFAGGGVYDHFIPTALETIISRPEFMTAYTPYQAEVSQGTLQVIYEFQTCICRLTGMDVANASMYDGASAAAEAISLSVINKKRSRVLISETVSPLYRNVIETYLCGRNIKIDYIPYLDGITAFDKLKKLLDEDTACVLLSQPNFFGLLEDIEAAAELTHKSGAYLIVSTDPIAAALLKTPGECGVDIVVGEGQPLGIPLNFGGPLLGFLAVKEPLIRNIPGRLAARTNDADGNPGFVLTLQTREQHIRRDKATSNICTNQALCATAALVYMTLLGKNGLRRVALLSMEKTHNTAKKIFNLAGYGQYFKGDFIREVVIRTPISAEKVIDRLIRDNGILPGINLGRYYKGMENALLLTVTEKRTEAEIDALIGALKG